MEQFLDQFLKPVRITYSGHEIGPLLIGNRPIRTNRRQYKIDGVPFSVYYTNLRNSTILYIHTYNSTRFEVRTMLLHALKKGFNVVSIQVQRVSFANENNMHPKVDPNGIITFGYYEYRQIHTVMEWIKNNINEEVIIWGRSMGAVCAVRYQHHYGEARELVLDSPFHNLVELFTQKLAQITLIPTFLAKGGVKLMKSTLNDKLTFNIDDLSIDKEINSRTPVTFLFNRQDSISSESCKILYEVCKGKKQIFYLQCPHEGERDSNILERVCDQLRRRHLDKETYIVKKRQFGSHMQITRKRKIPILYESAAFLEEEERFNKKIIEKPTNSQRERSFLESSCLF